MNECKKHGLPEPEIEVQSGGINVTVFKDQFHEQHLKELGLNDRQIIAVLYIKKNGNVTNKKYRELFQISNKTAYLELSDIVELGLLKKEGAGKKVHYILGKMRVIKR